MLRSKIKTNNNNIYSSVFSLSIFNGHNLIVVSFDTDTMKRCLELLEHRTRVTLLVCPVAMPT